MVNDETESLDITFEPQEEIDDEARDAAEEAVSFAGDQLELELDYSEESVAIVESILEKVSLLIIDEPQSERSDLAWSYADIFGSYVGEVYRKHHGGSWGIAKVGQDKFPAVGNESTGDVFWPTVKAWQRLTSGAEHDVWNYYRIVVGATGEADA